MIENHLGIEIAIYLVEVYNFINGEVIDLDDDRYLAFPKDQDISYEDLMAWYQGDLIEKKVEIYRARSGSFIASFDRNGKMEFEYNDIDCSTGYNGSAIDWRYYDADGCCGEEIPYED